MLNKWKMKLSVPKELMGISRITWIENQLILYHYQDILMISEENIELSNYSILGTKLNVVSIDKVRLEIKGNITQIKKKG